ncbi:MAG: hypothetical protein Q4G00_03740 [Clostridia bacterium]|jgi:hypothetical protein|nr:hypothetical protein [Clostridia bacterium]
MNSLLVQAHGQLMLTSSMVARAARFVNVRLAKIIPFFVIVCSLRSNFLFTSNANHGTIEWQFA